MAILRKDIRVAFWATVSLVAVGFAYVAVLLFAGGSDDPVAEAEATPGAEVDPLAAWTPESEPATPTPRSEASLAVHTVTPAPEVEDAWYDEPVVSRTPSPRTGDPGALPRVPQHELPNAAFESSDSADLPAPPAWRDAVYTTTPPAATAATAARTSTPAPVEPESEPAPADRVFDAAAQTHVIASGDNFVTIAARYYGDPNAFDVLRRANPDLDPTRLRIGDTVIIPALDDQREPIGHPKINADAKTHTVRGGQTLSDIAAERLGRSNLWREIYDLNRDVIGSDPGNLSVGMVLKLPR